ncbi:TPA: hypothetical protein ACH3X2_006087 [Trebouxia sp. C0005]
MNMTVSLHMWARLWPVVSLLLGWLTTYGKALEDTIVATAACNSLSGMHVQGVAGLSNGRTSAAWNVIQAAAKAAVQWTTVYGRSILGAYVPDGLHGDMKGLFWSHEPSSCTALSSRAHQYAWLLESHTLSPSALGESLMLNLVLHCCLLFFKNAYQESILYYTMGAQLCKPLVQHSCLCLGGLILAAACAMWMWTLWRQVSFSQQQLASEILRLRDVQKHIQADAAAKMSKRAGQDFLFDRGISGTLNAGSGIPANYGAAPGNPTPESPRGPAPTLSHGMASTEIQTPLNTRDGAVPAIHSSGDPIGMAGDALTPTSQEVLKDDASTHVQENGSVPLTQSQGNTPVPTTITTTTHHLTNAHVNSITHAPNMEVATGERPEEIIEEVIPVFNECLQENRLAVVIQQLLKMVEAAANPAQGTHFHLISGGVNVNECLLPDDKGSQFATLNIDAFLVSVDVFQQEGKFTAAFTLLTKVLGVAHWASLPAGKQAELHGRRALVSRAANQPVASFADWLHASQLDPSSSAAVEVVNQLGHWGNSDSICLFFQGIQGCLRDGGGTCCDALQARVDFWLSAGRCIAKVVNKAPSPKKSGEALIEEMSPLVRRFPQNQAVMCLQARQLLQLGRFQDVLQAVAPSLGCNSDLAPSRWALHLTLHVHWLTGGLDQMVVALEKLLKTECSPLEGSVGYTVPLNNLLAPLLSQLEGLQALWAQVDRCFLGDVDSAEGVLKQVDASCRGLMSPLLRSRQLLLWAQLHYARACCAMNAGQPAVQDVVKALAACERARALDPLCWRKAVEMQAYLLRMLGSGGALYDLYSALLTEPDLTAEELVDYSALQAAADTLPLPGLCDKWDAMHKPPLNPAQLLGVSFDATPEQVNSARNKLTVCCHPDKACLPGNSFVAELEGVGALMGDVALQAMERLQGARLTISLVNGACYTMTNRFLKAHAEAWFNLKYSHDYQIGIPVPLAFQVMVIPVTMENLWAVREIRHNLGGESEHQDVAPDEQDIQKDGGQHAQEDWNPGSDEAYEGGFWGGDENDLPEYEDD